MLPLVAATGNEAGLRVLFSSKTSYVPRKAVASANMLWVGGVCGTAETYLATSPTYHSI